MKTETLEEYIDDLLKDYSDIDKAKYGLLIRVGVKWQTKRSYSEEEVIQLVEDFKHYLAKCPINEMLSFKEWFEQFKKK